MCFACRVVAGRLGRPLAPAVPATLCPLPGPLYRVLMGYKESSVGEARHRFASLVSRLFAAFLGAHGACVVAAGRGWPDLVLPVPSSARPSGSPLQGVPGLAEAVGSAFPGACWAPGLLGRAGPAVGHMRPAATAFVVASGERSAVTGARVLLLDDTYVSGARAQSAAAALRAARARRVVVAPLARVLRPDRSARQAAFLHAHAERLGAPDAGSLPDRCGRCQRQSGASTE